MAGQATHARGQAGFTLIEVMVAAGLLLVGVLGTLTLFTAASRATVTTKAREQAVALQREIVEGARSLSYDKLTPNSVVPALQALPDLGDDQPTVPGWQINRRGFTYTVAVGACSVDDPSDGVGVVDDSTFCASGSGGTSPARCTQLLGVTGAIQGTSLAATAGLDVGNCGIDLNLDGQIDNLTRAQVTASGLNLCTILGMNLCPTSTPDTNPDDYKRVVTLVRWAVGGGSRFALQSTTLPNPGMSAAPQVVSMNTTGPTTVTSKLTTSVPFVVTTSRTPASVAWLLDGTTKGTASGAASAWTFSWNIGAVSAGATPNAGEVLDGTYVVGAKAFDSYGDYGSTKSQTISLNRRVPYAPTGFAAGRNAGGSGGSSVVDFQWNPNQERDIVGYRVYRQPTLGSAVQVCPATTGDTTASTSCEATSQPTSALVSYYMVAVDRDSLGALREGDPSAATAVTLTNSPPSAPGTLSASSTGGNTVLSWVASAGDPDLGDSVSFYRIYRDGTTFADRYDRTGTGAELSYTDTHVNGVQHTYRVVAVDTQLAESPFSNAVTK